jgi:hypothetical protein
LSLKKQTTKIMIKIVITRIHSHTVFSLFYAPSCSFCPSSPSCPARGEERREMGKINKSSRPARGKQRREMTRDETQRPTNEAGTDIECSKSRGEEISAVCV